MQTELLSFTLLDERIDASSKDKPERKLLRLTQGFWFLMAFVAGALATIWLHIPISNVHIKLAISVTLVVSEVLALIVGVRLDAGDTWKEIRYARKRSLQELDAALPKHMALIEWLSAFPAERLCELRDYAAYRQERLKEKLPVLIGGMEKLGFLPLVAAVCLQLYTLGWPSHFNFAAICGAAALFVLYCMSINEVALRLRLHNYDILLAKAIERKNPKAPCRTSS